MSSMKFNARLNTSHHGLPRPCKDVGVVADNLTGIHNAMVRCFFVVKWSCIHRGLGVPTGKNPEDSSQVSVEATQWVLHYISLGHVRKPHTAQLKCALHHQECTTFFQL
jgi:hypothetical protein